MLAIPRSWDQLHHGANGVMTDIHDFFLPDDDDGEYSISLKKIMKKRGLGQLLRTGLGLTLIVSQGGIP